MANRHTTQWTDERIAEMRRLAALGRSALQIAGSLACGLTRRGVIGKANREGIALLYRQPPKAAKPIQRPRPKKIAKPAVVPTPAPEPVVITPRTTPLVSIMELKDGVCKFPIGDPRDDDFGYCGAQTPDGGGPYCCEHRLIAYTGKAFPSSGRPFRLSPIGLPRIVYEVAE